MRILMIASYPPSLMNFRGSLLRSLVALGHQVSVVAPFTEEDSCLCLKLVSIGVNPVSIILDRSGIKPWTDALSVIQLFAIFKRNKPDCILAYTVKPVVYAGLVLRFYRLWMPKTSPNFVPLITGLGFAFTLGDRGTARSLLRHILRKLYKAGLRPSKSIVFQNPDDLEEFQDNRLLPSDSIVKRVWGSGVDLDLFPPQPLPKAPTFLLLARLLADKGIREYVNSARQVKKSFPSVVFRLAGMLDPNPAAISRGEVEGWIAEGVIEYLGDLHSVQPALTACRFYVLPSYREGTPRSVLEAMATGRPILTTDAPGCRETVIDGVNGFLVPPRDSEALANAMLRLIEQPESETQRMAQASLELARERFDVHKVNAQLLEVIGA